LEAAVLNVLSDLPQRPTFLSDNHKSTSLVFIPGRRSNWLQKKIRGHILETN